MSTPDLTKRNYPARLFERTSPATFYISSIYLFAVAGSFLLLLSGCSSVGGEVQAGRNALQTNRPADSSGN